MTKKLATADAPQPIDGREYKFTLAGFTNPRCNRCHGTGKLGYTDYARKQVQPCPCTVYFLDSDIRSSVEEASQSESHQAEIKNEPIQ